MNEMIKRVAMALNPGPFTGTEKDMHRYCSPLKVSVVQGRLFDQARTAIEAMREPTPEMKGDGGERFSVCTPMLEDRRVDAIAAGQIWEVMIDAALSVSGTIDGDTAAVEHLRATREAADAGSERTFNELSETPIQENGDD